jgi:simple sugar transport system ATP-binding protein
VDPDLEVWQLSVGEKQRLEILKCLIQGAKILILDEPTAVLAPTEIKGLYEIIKALVSDGISVIFISHKLDEVMEIADDISILRDGKLVGTVKADEITSDQLAKMMIGRSVLNVRKPTKSEKQPAALIVDNITCRGDRGPNALNGISFEVNAGEIVGIAGVDGNGQTELAECIAGIREWTSGSIIVGERLKRYEKLDRSVFGFIPEDSAKSGLVLDFSISENLILNKYNSREFSKFGWMHSRKISEFADRIINKYKIRIRNKEIPARVLSGGLRQLVMIAREMNSDPSIFLASQPTRGLDVGVIEVIHNLLWELRDRGAAIILISTELNDLLTMSDRLLVISRGRILGEINDCDNPDIVKIGQWMMGNSG